MAVRRDCRHYAARATPAGDLVARCRVEANEPIPFACPAHCLFFEARSLSNTGWERAVPLDRGPRPAGGGTADGG